MKLKKKNAFPIIAIGSSAGGIPVIQKITGKLPTLFNAAILFMQHLSPDHKSLLPELLSNQRPDLHFAEMRNNDELQAGLLYLPVPGKNIQIESGIFKTSDFSDVLHLPIDTLFTSLAKEYQERVTGIILSGSGKDGNRGCAEIRDSGGTVIVQDPATAEFGSMPQSVIKTAYFDQILPPEKIISEIIRIIEAQSASGFFDELIKPDRVSALVDILYKKTGYRFDHYKPTVIARRVQRRMQLNGFNDVNLYFNTLANNDTEASLITNDMMIGVTRFFRDYSQWEMLRESVVVPLLTITSNRPVRVWCAGCSTGEEAYSIGMLFMLEMEKRRIKRELQIFATDINEKAIDKARKGIYFENILTDIPPEYLRRFFICLSDGHTLEVVNEVREQIVFSKQDILRDLPFSKIDLCVCRNVLIYMTPEAQNKCTLIFHYALREEGFLFLGTSEGIEPQSDLFKQYSSEKFHIFRRIPGAHPKLPVPEHPMTTETLKQDVGHAPVQPGNDEFFYRIQAEALEILGAAVLVVDKDFRIIYQSEASTRYLMLSDSKILYNFFTVLPANLHNQIRAVFRSMQEGENPVVVDGNMINSVGVIVPVAITLSKIPDRVEQYLIILQKKVSNPKVEADLLTVETDIGSPSRAIHLLEKELAATRYDLQKHIGQLRSMNEEMQTANEELQTSNEELETSEEELRTINEELMSTNSQLQAKIEELERIQAILRDSEEKYRTLADNAPEVIARFDLQLRHIFVNEYGARVYGVSRDQVIGKTNADLGMPAGKVAFWKENFENVLSTGQQQTVEFDFESKNFGHQYFSSLFVPEFNKKHQIISILAITREITDIRKAQEEMKKTEQALRESEDRLQFALRSTHTGAWDIDLQDHTAYRSLEHDRIFGYKELLPQWTLDDFLHHALPEYREEVEKMVADATAAHTGWTYECRIRRADGVIRWIWFSGSYRTDLSGRERVAGIVQDITDRKAAAFALRQSEERWNLAIENFAEGAIIATEDEQIIYWNPAAREMHGFTRSDEGLVSLEKASTIFELWTADGTHKVDISQWPMRRIKHGEKVHNYELRLRRPDQGWEKYFSYSGSMVETAEGERLIFLSAHDLTEQHESKEALRESENKFRAVFEQAAVGIGRVNLSNGKWLDVNTAFCTMLGYSVREFQTTPWPQITHPEDIDSDLIPFKKMANGELDSYSVEKRFIHKKGHYVWTRLTLSLVRDEYGTPAYEIAIIEDISRSKQTQEQLRRSEELLRLSQQVARIGTFEYDIRKNTSTWSESLEMLYGLPAGSFSGSYDQWRAFVHPDDLPGVERKLKESLKNDHFETEWRIIRPEGFIRWIAARGQVFRDSNGKPIRLVGINLDITERKENEEALRHRTEELSAVNQELESFSYSVAHDLRNPLRTIGGFAEFLFEDYSTILDDEGKEYIDKIRKGVFRMNSIIDDILALSKISRQDMEIGDVDMSNMARLVCQELSTSQPDRIITVDIQPGMRARADARLVSVILGNLLSNAWKYTSKVSNPVIKFAAFKKDGKKVYFIRDNGAGFDMKQAEKLFTPFKRLHSDDEFAGTGVGLATVERAIKRHGGKIWAEGETGKGATFYFTLES